MVVAMDPQTKHPQAADEQQAEFMVGALIGAMAGAAAALLLTPKNGKEMRAIVKEYAKEWEGEAYELAKDSRGVTKSLRQALDESAAQLAETAPQTIGDAAQHAHQFASTLEQHIDSARGTVSEIAEAFRSGWEEYGEEIVVEQSKTIDSRKIDLPDVLLAEEIELEEEDQPARPHPVSHGRRRSTSHHYAMHSADTTDHHDQDKADKDDKPASRPMLASEEIVDTPAAKPHYTTRVLEEATPARRAKAEDKAEDKADKDDKPAKKSTKDHDQPAAKSSDDEDKPSKKLFFRRGS